MDLGGLFFALLLILVPVLPIVSFFLLCKKTIKLINDPDSRYENDTELKRLIAVLFTPVGFCATAFLGFRLSYPTYRSGFMSMDIGPGLPALILLSFALFIFSWGIWVSNFSLKWIIGASASISVPFFAGIIHYRSWTDIPPNLDPIYDSSGLEGVAAIYGCLFLLPAFIFFMRYVNNPT